MLGQWGKHWLSAWAVTAVLVVSGSARAGMIPVSVTVQPDGGKYRWTYGVIVTTDVQVNPGDSFTIYDFSGLMPGSVVAPNDWSISQANSTTPHVGTNPSDDPFITDLTFTYNGSMPLVGQQGLGNFSAISDHSSSVPIDFTSSTHRQIDGRLENNITTTDGPGVEPPPPPSETPEPASLALMALGLPVVGLVRRLRRKVG